MAGHWQGWPARLRARLGLDLMTTSKTTSPKMINRDYLDELNEDDLPQNSDVVLILSQTVAAMNAFQARYYGWDGSEHTWYT
jgi:hypothetical protein